MTCLWFSCVGRSRDEEADYDPKIMAATETWDENYVEGDEDEKAIASLLNHNNGKDIRHALALALPREKWADVIVKNMQCNRNVSLESNSPHDPSPHQPFLVKRNNSQSPNSIGDDGLEEDVINIDAIESMNDSLRRKVARNFMTFTLGIHPDFPNKSVGEGIMNDIQIEKDEIHTCYENVLLQVCVWAQRRLSTTKNRRTSASGVVYINADAPEMTLQERKQSPKMFLNDTDDELRTFIGVTKNGVPLIRLIVMRVTENSTRTNNTTIQGLLVVNVDFAEQIEKLRIIYANWLIEEIVKRLGNLFDFIRLAEEFVKKGLQNSHS